MSRTRSDTGAISLSGLLSLSAVVFLVCLLFLVIDVRHRASGYRAVSGQGIQGTVTVTECRPHRTGTFCTGRFTSADGRIAKPEIRINGAMRLLDRHASRDPAAFPVRYPAALSDADADEAWTLAGQPWLWPSKAQIAALVPVAAPLILIWVMLQGGPSGRRHRMDQARQVQSWISHRRELAHQRQIRRGLVH